MYKVKVNFEADSAPGWAKNFSQKMALLTCLSLAHFGAIESVCG